MTNADELTIPLVPMAWARPRASRWGGFHTDPKRKQWREDAIYYIRQWWGKRAQLVGPVHLIASFVLPRPKDWPKTLEWPKKRTSLAHFGRHDVDNFAKLLMDCLQCAKGERWNAPLLDDGQIAHIQASKRYAWLQEDAHVWIKLWKD